MVGAVCVAATPILAATCTAFENFRRVPTDTRGGSIIPQIPILRHGLFYKSFVRNGACRSMISPDIVSPCETPDDFLSPVEFAGREAV
jgi:hypothetical protein